jgi:hypothetical protein
LSEAFSVPDNPELNNDRVCCLGLVLQIMAAAEKPSLFFSVIRAYNVRDLILFSNVIEVDDLPAGKSIQKLPIVSGAVSSADNRCLGKLFDYGAQLFAHFPEPLVRHSLMIRQLPCRG